MGRDDETKFHILGWDMSKSVANEIKILSENCGLPQSWAEENLVKLVQQSGQDPALVNLDQLREILAEFLQDVFVAAQEHYKENSAE